MTTLTTLTSPAASAARRRPVPWTKLAWVTWRQHRFALAGVVALLGVLSLYMLIMGLKMRSTLSSLGLDSCHPVTIARCATQLGIFQDAYYARAQTLSGVLQVVPVLIGVFTGGPLLARELETGTFRFAWTQGCGRLRWTVAKIALIAAAVTGAAAAFSLLFSWYYQPFFAARTDSVLAPQLFDLRGVNFAAWTLAAFAIATFAGAVIRRVVPAMAAALAAWTGLDLATVLFLRGHYETPVVATSVPGGNGSALPWVLNQWWTGPDGHVASSDQVRNVLQGFAPRGTVGIKSHDGPKPVLQWLAQHHFTQWFSYQPASRYWHFQAIEGGWLLALAVILGAATVWLVRHRAA
jgi:hypothetical protein